MSYVYDHTVRVCGTRRRQRRSRFLHLILAFRPVCELEPTLSVELDSLSVEVSLSDCPERAQSAEAERGSEDWTSREDAGTCRRPM